MTAKPVEEANLATEAEEFEEKQNDFQAMYDAGGKFKRDLEQITTGFGKEKEPVHTREHTVEELEEIPAGPELEPGTEGYMEKVEKEAELAGGVTDDYTQRVLFGAGMGQKTTVTLPLTAEETESGLHQKVWKSIRWLAIWCVRQIKLLGEKANFKSAG